MLFQWIVLLVMMYFNLDICFFSFRSMGYSKITSIYDFLVWVVFLQGLVWHQLDDRLPLVVGIMKFRIYDIYLKVCYMRLARLYQKCFERHNVIVSRIVLKGIKWLYQKCFERYNVDIWSLDTRCFGICFVYLMLGSHI